MAGSAVEPGQAAKDVNVGGFNTSGGVVGRYDQRPDDPDADFVQPRKFSLHREPGLQYLLMGISFRFSHICRGKSGIFSYL